MQKSGLAGIATFLAIAAAPTALAEPNFYEEGTKAYSKGDFTLAARCFLSEVKTHGDNASAYYYLGNSYSKLKRKRDAIQAYQSAINLDADGTAGTYSKTAMDALQPPPPPPAPVSSHATLEPQAGSSTQSDAAMLESAEEQRLEKELREKSETQINTLREQMHNEIAALGQPLYARGRNYYTPDDQPVRSYYDTRIEQIKKDTQRRINELKKYYEARASARH